MTADELVEKVADVIKDNTYESEYARAAVALVVEECAKAIGDHNKAGREWVSGSLWDSLTREAQARIRSLSPSSGVKDREAGR